MTESVSEKNTVEPLFTFNLLFVEDSRLYLAILGLVFDVTRGAKVLYLYDM